MEVVREVVMQELDMEEVLLLCLHKEGTNKEDISLAHIQETSLAHTQETSLAHTQETSLALIQETNLVRTQGIILLRSSLIRRDHSLQHTVAYLAIVVGIRKHF